MSLKLCPRRLSHAAALSGVTLLLSFIAGDCARLVSIADLHGDYDRTLEVLIASGFIDPETLAWAAGNATLVQTGDIADRGSDAKNIYELFFRLSREATEVGGRVVNLLGNHDIMNIQGDLRYVTDEDVEAFGGAAARLSAWSAQGWLGSRVREFPAAVAINGVLFVHAGLHPQVLREYGSLDNINHAMAAVLATGSNRRGKTGRSRLLGTSGPLWTRYFARPESLEVCSAAAEALNRTGTLRMVVGHTIQESPEGYRVKAACGGRLVLADTAISRAYGGEVSYLEHYRGGGMAAVYPGAQRRVYMALARMDSRASSRNLFRQEG